MKNLSSADEHHEATGADAMYHYPEDEHPKKRSPWPMLGVIGSIGVGFQLLDWLIRWWLR